MDYMGCVLVVILRSVNYCMYTFILTLCITALIVGLDTSWVKPSGYFILKKQKKTM